MLLVFLFHSQLFIWQAHNALFMIRCLLKVFIREMSEEELHLQFSYHERAPGSCGGELNHSLVWEKEEIVVGQHQEISLERVRGKNHFFDQQLRCQRQQLYKNIFWEMLDNGVESV